MCRHSANLGDLQGRAAWSLLDITEEWFYPFLNRFYQFLTTPQMHLVNIQCDNAPERALHLTGEEEEEIESVVAQWLAHSPLVLEVPGSIPPHGEENFRVRTCFL